MNRIVNNCRFVMAFLFMPVAILASLFFGNCASAASLTMTLSDTSLLLSVFPYTDEGTFADSGDLNIGVALTGQGGYTLGIKAVSSEINARNLVNSDAGTALYSISSPVTPSNYANNSYAVSNNLNNTWAYLPSKYDSVVNSDYRPAPALSGDILDKTTSAGDGTSVNYTLSIGARADLSTKPGSYANTFVIFAVANLPDCNPLATNISEAVCMQDINDSIISSMETHKQYQLYDNRDYKEYYIAKMADGRVWMTQNLDLDLETTPTNVATLTSENTDLNTFGSDYYTTSYGYSCSNSSTTCADGVITWKPSSATTATASSWTTSSTAPQSYDYGNQYRWVSNTGTTSSYASSAACMSAHNDGSCPHYHVGNYYNWTAAVASNYTSGLSTNYKVMGNSICPAGWRLPQGKTSTSTSNSGYYSEANYTWKIEGVAESFVSGANTSATWTSGGWTGARNNPLYIVASGYKTGAGTPSGLANYARIWTSTISTSSNAQHLYMYSSGAYPIYNYSRSSGIAVRCIARQSNTGSTVITFDKNASDAVGSTSAQSISANTLGTLANSDFSRDGYIFNSWNTEPDGSGATYAPGDKYYAIVGTDTTNVTLYAQWDKGYTVTFKANDAGVTGIYFDGTKYTNNQTVMAYEGHTYIIGGDYTARHGFSSWAITDGSLADDTHPSTTFTMDDNDVTITLASQEATTDMSSLPISTGPVSSNCKNEAVTPMLVYDSRDDEAYWVARLCDGNYWMLDNLRLDLTDSAVTNTLNESNTNASNVAINYLRSGGGSTSNQWPTSGLTNSNWISSSSYSVPRVNISGNVNASTGNNKWGGSYTKNSTSFVSFGRGSGKNGAYYNMCAASAGTYCWGNGTNSSGSPTTDPNTNIAPTAYDISGDICPKGWRIPTGGSYNALNGGGELQNLYNKYSGAAVTQAVAFEEAFSITLSGNIGTSGSMANYGNSGYFWASTWNNTSNMYDAYASLTGVSFNSYFARSNGLSVRCLRYDPVSITVNFAGGGVKNVTFMDINSGYQTVVSTSGSVVTLDRNKQYKVYGEYNTQYGFLSWAATEGNFSNQYPVSTYTVVSDATITLTSQQATTDISTIVASDDTPSDNCKNEPVSPQLVYDSRDNEAYWVAELCDGNVWMLENLRLDLNNSEVAEALNSSNTNAPDIALNYLKNGGGTTSNKYPTTGLSGVNWTSSASSSYTAPLVNTNGTANNTNNTVLGSYDINKIAPVMFGAGSGKIGAYYNYCAASAGTYCWGNESNSNGSPTTDPNTSIVTTGIDIEGDICPKGWRLPTGGPYDAAAGTGEFANLYNKYSGATIGQDKAFKEAFSVSLSGYINTGLLNNLGNNGYFWSSTWSNTSNFYRLDTTLTTANTAAANGRSLGYSIRCVLK